MTYAILSVANTAEIEARRGSSTVNQLCIMLGPNYPLQDGITYYAWDDTSEAPIDNDRYLPGAFDAGVGRWVRVDSADIAAIHVQPDWAETLGTSLSFIKNKPSISIVGVSGQYSDLIGKPTIPTVSTVGSTGQYTDLIGKPTLFSGSYTDLTNKPSLGKTVVGTTVKSNSFRIYKNATVSAGIAVFNLTDDGTSTGNALFNEVYTDSVQPIVSDSLASYQFSWVFSNSNKTLTVTANKLTTSNILTGILGQTQANAAVVKLIVEGN